MEKTKPNVTCHGLRGSSWSKATNGREESHKTSENPSTTHPTTRPKFQYVGVVVLALEESLTLRSHLPTGGETGGRGAVGGGSRACCGTATSTLQRNEGRWPKEEQDFLPTGEDAVKANIFKTSSTHPHPTWTCQPPNIEH